MSYCRWSSDNWKSDIYAYESDYGYEIHVAGNRIVGDVPPVDYMADIETVKRQYAAYSAFMDGAERVPINLPHAGESFTCGDLEDFAWRLRLLREVGYHVPDYVFEEIAEEIAAQEEEAAT